MMEGGGATVRHRGRRFKRTSSGKQEGVGSQQTGNGMSTATASLGLSPTIVLPPPVPPQLTSRGRPLSAKGRPRPQSVNTSSTHIQQFQHQRFKPLPTIGAPPPSLHARTRVATGHVTETDSAVDLDYASSSSPSPISHPPTPSLHPSVNPHQPPLAGFKVTGRHFGLSALPNRTVVTMSAASLSPQEAYMKSLTPRESYSNGGSKYRNFNNNDCTRIASKSTPAARSKSRPVDSRIPEEPLASEAHTVLLCVKIPSGCRVQRRFRLSDLLCHVMAFAVQHCEQEGDWELSTSDVPKRVFEDLSLTLNEAGLAVRTLLHLTHL